MTTHNTQLGLIFTPEYEVLGAKPTKLTFNAHLSAPEVVEDTSKRSTISLTAVIDKSGSMNGEKLELVKRTCAFMLNQLSSQDKMGLVEYDSHVHELIPLSRTSELFKTEAKSVIESMQAGSCTNLSGGLFKGVKQQQANTFVDWDHAPAAPAPARARPQSPTSSESSAETEEAEFNPVQLLALQNEAGDAAGSLPKQSKSLMHRFQSVARRVMGTASKKKKSAVQQQAPAIPAQPLQMNRGRAGRSRSTRFGRDSGWASKTLFDGQQPGPALPVEDDALRSVFLFTDGLANEGIENTEELVSALGSLLDGTPRVRVYTFGFGADHSPAMLAELARVGAGTYYFMEKEESIPTAFADALGGLLSVAAQNVTVDFTPAPGVSVSAVHSGFGTSEAASGARKIAVGDLLSEEGKDLLMELALPAWEGEGAGAELSVGTLGVSYLDVQGACLRTQEIECKVQRARAVPASVQPNEGVALQLARIETAAAMADARRAAESGDLARARAQLQACLEQVESVASESAFKEQLCQDLREAQTNMVDVRTYASRGSKLMWAKGKAHMEQRSACLSDSEGEEEEEEAASRRRAKTFSYANVQQKSMRKLAKSSMRSW